MSRVCPYRDCAEQNAPDASFCAVCGRALIPHAGKPRCRWCGVPISYGAKSCMAHRDLTDPFEAAA